MHFSNDEETAHSNKVVSVVTNLRLESCLGDQFFSVILKNSFPFALCNYLGSISINSLY